MVLLVPFIVKVAVAPPVFLNPEVPFIVKFPSNQIGEVLVLMVMYASLSMVILPVKVMGAAPPINSPSVIVVVPLTVKSANVGCNVPSVITRLPFTVISSDAS